MASSFAMKGDNPVGVHGGKSLPVGNLPCTQADIDVWSAAGAYFPGTKQLQFSFIDGLLLQLADGRAVGTWVPDGAGKVNGDGDVVYQIRVGDPEPTVTLSVPGSTLTEVQFNLVLVAMDAGVGTVIISTEQARNFEVGATELVRMTNRLGVYVAATKF